MNIAQHLRVDKMPFSMCCVPMTWTIRNGDHKTTTIDMIRAKDWGDWDYKDGVRGALILRVRIRQEKSNLCARNQRHQL